MRWLLLCLGALVILPFSTAAVPWNSLCRQYSGYDLNHDGRIEIESLRPLDSPAGGDQQPFVLVLVEDRLLQPLDAPGTDLVPSLRQYRDDLARDGWRAMLVAARVYSGTVHQDGETLLAIRRFFKAVRASDPGFAGAVLVGSFPEAMLVRSCDWVRTDEATVGRGTSHQRRFDRVPQIRVMAELVAERCELVLSDLDGHWERTYRQPRTRLPWVLAAYPDGVPNGGGPTPWFQTGSNSFEDFFYVNDGQYTTREVKNESGETELDVRLVAAGQNAECATEDLRMPNPICRPDIRVSRLNTRGVAWSPRADIRGVSGEGLLDGNGVPERVVFKDRLSVPSRTYAFDPPLERKLLIDYFARNHRYRHGGFKDEDRPAAVSYGLRSGWRRIRWSMPEWKKADTPQTVIAEASLAQYATWLTQPAIFRDVRAHSYPEGSLFGRCRVSELEKATGPGWYWRPRGNTLVPSLSREARRGIADFFLYRTLWGNGRMPDEASFYFHTGCDAISPDHADKVPYNNPKYGWLQGAESLLFYGGGLALVGRSKVFYDAPRGFHHALWDGQTFGQAWRDYFQTESQAHSYGEVGGDIGRKRSYFWSVLGDWTLRLRPAHQAAE